MLKKSFQQISDLLMPFGLFLLSNIAVFINVLWLEPQLTFVEMIVWLALTVVMIRFLCKHDKGFSLLDVIRKNWILLLFVTFSGFSIFWSVFWQVSLYRWLTLLCTIVAAGYLATRYDMKDLAGLLSIFGIYILFLSTFLVFFAPNIGIMNYHSIQGAWRGIYWHKNHMGMLASFVNILFLVNIVYGMQVRGKNILYWGLLYVYSLFFLYQSDSVGAYMTTIGLHAILLLALLFLKFKAKIQRQHYLYFFAAITIVLVILYFNLEGVFGLFNRNTSLTGRVPMWGHLFSDYLAKRPAGGYGFNAFWYIESHRVFMQYVAHYPDPIVISDNGFIDILMNTGYIGLILLVLFYLVAWGRSIQYAINATDVIGLFPLIFMSYTLLANISWSLIFENENFFMLILLAVLFLMDGIRPNGVRMNQP